MREALLNELEAAILCNDKNTQKILLDRLSAEHDLKPEEAKIMAFNKDAGR